MSVLRIATRASELALAQARGVAAAIERAHRGIETRIVEITTAGDLDRVTPVADLTQVGAFVRAVQQAVLDGRADVAVHSGKDLPVAGPVELDVVYPPRASPWDVLVGATVPGLPVSGRVGTGSPRRTAQLRLLRPDLVIEEIRGNVDTRLSKVAAGDYTAVVLAEAGLQRLDRTEAITQRFGLEEMVPAPAQGALAVEAIQGGQWWAHLQAIDDPTTRIAMEVERGLLQRTGAGCRSALGVFAAVDDGGITATGFVHDGDGPRRAALRASTSEAAVQGLTAAMGLDT